jgi:hypothetical protein
MTLTKFNIFPLYFLSSSLPIKRGSEEIQRFLNQKVSSKFPGIVDFASRFIIIIESMNFKFRIYKNMNLDAKSTASQNFESTF